MLHISQSSHVKNTWADFLSFPVVAVETALEVNATLENFPPKATLLFLANNSDCGALVECLLESVRKWALLALCCPNLKMFQTIAGNINPNQNDTPTSLFLSLLIILNGHTLSFFVHPLWFPPDLGGRNESVRSCIRNIYGLPRAQYPRLFSIRSDHHISQKHYGYP